MIVAWMLYGLLVSVLLGAAAAVLAQGCRMLRLPSRFVWLAALVSTAALIALAPGREAPPTIMVAEIGLGDAAAVPTLRRSGPLPFATRAAAAARALVADGLRTAAGAGADAGTAVAGVWLLASGLLLVAALTTMGRAWLLRRGWDEREVAGVPVRVAPLAGPAVLGVIRPEVVIPRWLLDRPPLEQRVVVLHEQEHVRGGDPLVLAVGCLTAVLLPWNPLAWWMLLRLRLAVEMDCDHRVLRRGVPTAAYGSLLIHMAGRSPGLTLGVPALSGSPSTLERRIRAMTERSPRFAPLRAAALATLALGALVAACDTPKPTSAEIENIDVTIAEGHSRQ